MGDMLMPAMAPQGSGASPMTNSPVKPMGGNLDSAMANMASSTFQSIFYKVYSKIKVTKGFVLAEEPLGYSGKRFIVFFIQKWLF